VNAQLALALLALGPGVLHTKPGAGAAKASEAAKAPRDPIASLAREWLAKR
jgi:hypothetical protein